MTNGPTFSAYTRRLLAFIRQSTRHLGEVEPGRLGAAGITAGALAGESLDLAVEFQRLAQELFALQFEWNAPYRRFGQRRGVTPEKVGDWCEVPAVPTSAFQANDLTSLTPAERTAVFHSSRTTGQRSSRHFHDAASLAVYAASLEPWFRVHLLRRPPPGPWRVCSLTPSPALAPHSSLVHMFEVVRRELATPDPVILGNTDAEGTWQLDVKAAVDALAGMAEAGGPVLVLGTAFAFVPLLDGLAGRGRELRLPPGSRVLETGGYKGRSRALPKAELHARIARHLGIGPGDIVSEYGMCELSSQAYDRAAGRTNTTGDRAADRPRRFRFPPWARVRMVSPETGAEIAAGQTGLIQVWDLANVRSVMAVQTEDLGIRHEDGFELIGRAAEAERRGCSLQMG